MLSATHLITLPATLFVALVAALFFVLATFCRTCYCSLLRAYYFFSSHFVIAHFFMLPISSFCTCCFFLFRACCFFFLHLLLFPSSHFLFRLFVFVASPRLTCYFFSSCFWLLLVTLAAVLLFMLAVAFHLDFVIRNFKRSY